MKLLLLFVHSVFFVVPGILAWHIYTIGSAPLPLPIAGRPLPVKAVNADLKEFEFPRFPAQSAFDATHSRPLFSKSRRPVSPLPRDTAEEPDDRTIELIPEFRGALAGIVDVRGARLAVIVRENSDAPTYVGRFQRFDGWLLTGLDSVSATFVRGNNEKKFTLKYK